MKSPGRIFAVVNQKGGVGKTTTAINLAASLAQSRRRVLLIDSDPQANATSGLGIDKATVEKSLFDTLVDGMPLTGVIQSNIAGISGLDIVPSTLDLSGAEMALYTEQNFNRETVLKKALAAVTPSYDCILIDAPPSLGLLTVNILTAADRLLIPIQCEYYALEGISQLLEIIARVKDRLNPHLEIALVVLTMQDSRTNLSQQVIEEVRSFFGDRVAQTVIPRNVRLSEAPSFGQPISQYDPRSRGAEAYWALAQEVMRLT